MDNSDAIEAQRSQKEPFFTYLRYWVSFAVQTDQSYYEQHIPAHPQAGGFKARSRMLYMPHLYIVAQSSAEATISHLVFSSPGLIAPLWPKLLSLSSTSHHAATPSTVTVEPTNFITIFMEVWLPKNAGYSMQCLNLKSTCSTLTKLCVLRWRCRIHKLRKHG